MLVGASLALLGHFFHLRCLLYIVGPLALILAARESGCFRFPIPERKRQTNKFWAHDFGFPLASAMWGFDIGFGITTYSSNGGFLVLALTAAGFGHPVYGAILMFAYWIGRVIPVWIIPLLWGRNELPDLLGAVMENRTAFRHSAAFGLMWSSVIPVLLALNVRIL
jgi:cytochrome c biogenesis protein CcdA